jgi:hypothetical protein
MAGPEGHDQGENEIYDNTPAFIILKDWVYVYMYVIVYGLTGLRV